MTRVCIFRHGQADSLGKNYDTLTNLGYLQARRLGEYLVRMQIRPDYLASGSLQRQIQTLQEIRNTLELAGISTPEPVVHEELNEFDGNLWKKMAQKISESNEEFGELLERYRHLQQNGDPACKKWFPRIIHLILKEWIEGSHQDIYPFETYHNKVLSVLDKIPKRSQQCLLATSATPVAILAGYSLQLPKERYLPLMKVISNTSYNVFDWKKGVLSPITLNSYPHIQEPEEFSLM